jgi:hypothetical protein
VSRAEKKKQKRKKELNAQALLRLEGPFFFFMQCAATDAPKEGQCLFKA